MKSWVAAWTIEAALTCALNASAQERPTRLALTARVDDYADVPRRLLAEAEAYATTAYRSAGIELIWSPGVSAGTPPVERPFDVRVVILSGDQAESKCHAERLANEVMGVAMSAATHAKARIAYIFYDRIRLISLAKRASAGDGLGHVIAHEIGHLLIGINSHSEVGLMRPHWDPCDRTLQTFTFRQVRIIRERFPTTAN